jgi:hypothetical protein
LDKREARQIFCELVGTLNCAFPDFDFGGVRPEEFEKLQGGGREILKGLSNALWHLKGASTSSEPSYRSFFAFPPSTSLAASSSSPPSSSVSPPASHARLVSSAPAGTPFSLGPVSALAPNASSEESPTHPLLRQILDPIIELSDCDVYAYFPDVDSDPHAEESDDESVNDETEGWDEDDDEVGWSIEGLESPRNRGGRAGVYSDWREPSGPNTPAAGTPRKNLSYSSLADSYYQSNPGGSGAGGSSGNGGGGLLWSSNYFFHNKKMKRILFVSCWGRKVSYSSPEPPSAEDRLGSAIPSAIPSWVLGSNSFPSASGSGSSSKASGFASGSSSRPMDMKRNASAASLLAGGPSRDSKRAKEFDGPMKA